MALRRIDSIDEMHTYLAVAMQLEHATIPPYLTALYSMLPGRNSESSEVMRIVVVEEMLHMTLVANLMNSVGRHPDLTASGFVPRYPTHLPDGEADFEVSIRPFGREAVETLMRIERPGTLTDGLDLVSRPRSARALLPAYAHDDDQDMHFYSIGDFYGEIERGLRHLQTHEESGGATLFSGDPEAQVVIGEYFPDASQVGPVVDLDSALFAIDFITERGRGQGRAHLRRLRRAEPFLPARADPARSALPARGCARLAERQDVPGRLDRSAPGGRGRTHRRLRRRHPRARWSTSSLARTPASCAP